MTTIKTARACALAWGALVALFAAAMPAHAQDNAAAADAGREAAEDTLQEVKIEGRRVTEQMSVTAYEAAKFGIQVQLITDDELRRAGVSRTSVATNAIGVGWAAPTIYLAGSDWQKERFLEPIFTGEEVWCQLFSEPDSGSDLASLGTRGA